MPAEDERQAREPGGSLTAALAALAAAAIAVIMAAAALWSGHPAGASPAVAPNGQAKSFSIELGEKRHRSVRCDEHEAAAHGDCRERAAHRSVTDGVRDGPHIEDDLDGDGFVDRVYVADVRAQLYRVDIEAADGTAITPASWPITKIAALNDGIGGTDGTRKVFFAPDLVVVNDVAFKMDGAPGFADGVLPGGVILFRITQQ